MAPTWWVLLPRCCASWGDWHATLLHAGLVAATCGSGIITASTSPRPLPLQYYTYTATLNGTLMAKACAAGFTATVTVLGDSGKEGGGQVALGCGTCKAPAK